MLLTVLAREFEQSCYPLGPFRSPRLLKARCAGPRWAHRPARSHGFPTAPISRGAPDSLYVAGLGAMTPPVADGSGVCPPPTASANVNATPIVSVGGISAAVSFAGQAPGFPGVNQVNIAIPPNAPTGNSISPGVKSADGTVTSHTETIAVQ